MIVAPFTVTESEYLDFQKRIHRATLASRIRIRIWLALIALSGLWAVFELAKTQSSWTIFLLAGLAPVYLLYCVLFLMFSSSAMRKSYKSAARTLTNCHLEFEDEGCLWNVPEETNGRLYWKTYSSWMESKMAFALIRGGLVYPIPKSALSSNQLVELRELFIKHLGPEAP